MPLPSIHENKQQIPLSWLKRHPNQDAIFSETPESELGELAEDISRRGLQEAIHVCPDGTIIRGHRRVAAVKHLGWEKIEAVVRHDIDDPCSSAAIEDLINDNVMRRQLDDLELARCYQAMKAALSPGAISDGNGDLRDRLAARLNCGKSGRSMDRLERLLQLPRDIQDLITRNKLNKHQAEKILRLSRKRQQEVFEALRSVENIPEVLRHFGIIKPATSRSPAELGEELLQFFIRNLPTVRANLTALDRLQVQGKDVVDLLDDATEFMIAWKKRKRMLKQQAIKELQSPVTRRSKLDNLSGDAR